MLNLEPASKTSNPSLQSKSFAKLSEMININRIIPRYGVYNIRHFSGDIGKKGDRGEKGKILIVSEEESFEAEHTIESS